MNRPFYESKERQPWVVFSFGKMHAFKRLSLDNLLRFFSFLVRFMLLASSFPLVATLSTDNLVFVHVIYRHGDRSPSNTFPSSPHNETFWQDGWSQLTKKGMLQMYELGQYFRRRYAGFLDVRYRKEQIYVRSTDKDRTLQSASANLAGLYPPANDQQWNPSMPCWQPIPIHTVPVKQDILLSSSAECPAYDALFTEQAVPIIHKLNEEHKEFFQYLKIHTGLASVDFHNIGAVYGPLFRAREQGAELPAWSRILWTRNAHSTVYDHILELKRISRTIEFDSFEKAKFRAANRLSDHIHSAGCTKFYGGGYLLGDIVSRMQRKAGGKADKEDPSKMMVFSAHDGTVLALLYALKVSNHLIVPYASCLMIELYQRTPLPTNAAGPSFYVKLYLRNDTNVAPYELRVPGCEPWGPSCPIEQFVELTRASSLHSNLERRRYCGLAKLENNAKDSTIDFASSERPGNFACAKGLNLHIAFSALYVLAVLISG